MARLPWMIRTRFESQRNSSDSLRKQIFREIFLLYNEIAWCVYSLESPHRGDSNEYTPYNYRTEDHKEFPNSSPFASWPSGMINP